MTVRKINGYLADFVPGGVAQANSNATELTTIPQFLVLQSKDPNNGYAAQFHFDITTPVKTQLMMNFGSITQQEFGSNPWYRAGMVFHFGSSEGVFKYPFLGRINGWKTDENSPPGKSVFGPQSGKIEESSKIVYTGQHTSLVFNCTGRYQNRDDIIGNGFNNGGNSMLFTNEQKGWNTRIQNGFNQIDFTGLGESKYTISSGIYFWNSNDDPYRNLGNIPPLDFSDGAILLMTSNSQSEYDRNYSPEKYFTGWGMYGNVFIGSKLNNNTEPLLNDMFSSMSAPRLKISDHGISTYGEWADPGTFNDSQYVRYLLSVNNFNEDFNNVYGNLHITPYGEISMGVSLAPPSKELVTEFSPWWYRPTNVVNVGENVPPVGMPCLYLEADPVRHNRYVAVFSKGPNEEDADFKFTTDGKFNLRANGDNPAGAIVDVNLKGDAQNDTDNSFRIHESGAPNFEIKTNGTIKTAGEYNPHKGVAGWSRLDGTETRQTLADTSTITLEQLAELFKSMLDDLIDKGILQIGNALPSGPIGEFNWVSDGDANGVFYFLGGNPWSNPNVLGTVILSASAINGNIDVLVDRVDSDNNSFFTPSVANSWVQVDLIDKELRCNRYTLQNTDDYITVNWEFQGSNDGSTWTTLDTVTANPATPYAWVNRSLATPDYYRYFRVLMNGVDSAGSQYLTFSELEIYGDLRTI